MFGEVMTIDIHQTLQEFFKERVREVQEKNHIKLQEGTQFYLVNLLTQALEPKDLGEPLAFIYARALLAEHQYEKLQLMKEMGDRSLYVSGFFGESLNRKIIDLNYYIQMGCLAYQLASSLSKEFASSRLSPKIFSELSEKFQQLVDLLAEISESSGISSNQDLLQLYERWVETKSSRLFEKLKEEGIFPVDLEKGDPN